VRDAFNKALEKDATSFDKFSIIVVLHFHVGHIDGVSDLFGDGRNVTSRPALMQGPSHSLKLIEASLTGELAI